MGLSGNGRGKGQQEFFLCAHHLMFWRLALHLTQYGPRAQEARNSQDPSLAEAAGWAFTAISKAVQQAAAAAPQQ